jgi:hypothetical protein
MQIWLSPLKLLTKTVSEPRLSIAMRFAFALVRNHLPPPLMNNAKLRHSHATHGNKQIIENKPR